MGLDRPSLAAERRREEREESPHHAIAREWGRESEGRTQPRYKPFFSALCGHYSHLLTTARTDGRLGGVGRHFYGDEVEDGGGSDAWKSRGQIRPFLFQFIQGEVQLAQKTYHEKGHSFLP